MIRSLTALSLLVFVVNASAQNTGGNTSKATEKADESQIDYKQLGAPMPAIRLATYFDTSAERRKQDEILGRTKNGERKKYYAKGPTIITDKEVNNGANLFIMVFNPTCSHCEEETAMLEQNNSLFKKSKVLLMANPTMMPYLGDFVKMLRVEDYPMFYVGVDSGGYIDKSFLYQALPQINIYNAERKLIRVYSGEVSIDSLKQFIQ